MKDFSVRKTTLRFAAAAVVAALAACAAFGPHRASGELRSERQPGTSMRVFATGDTEGFLAPCGCEMAQYGGFARRAAYLRAVRRPGDVYVDLGNLLAEGGPSPKLTIDAALEGLSALGCDALVPAEGEIRMGDEFQQSAARHAALPVVCANLHKAVGGARVFAPWILKKTADGRTVAVIGVAEPFDGVPAGWRIAPMAESVRATIAELAGRADAIVVAGGVRDETASTLAGSFPNVALVVGGNSVRGSPHLMRTLGAPMMLVGDFAWHVGRAELDAKLRPTDAWLAWLDTGVPDAADVAGIVARWQASVSQENADFADKLVAQFKAQGFVGSETCASCHAAEYATWKASPHSHAMRTLAGKSSDKDPSCIACHLHDVPKDAKVPLAATSFGLGCEGCHGGAARHADLARRGSKDSAHALSPATREACVRCHHPPNSSHFDFDHDWPKIAHGRAAAK